MADSEQVRLLQQGVGDWNTWQNQNPTVGADLQSADLLQADLSGAKLAWADLSEANLREASLVQADLSEANLVAANLVGAQLREANLVRAFLTAANLQGADLRGANLARANLRKANVVGANLERANLRGANLVGVNLRDANLREADLRKVNLSGANLVGANLAGANLDQARVSYGELGAATFTQDQARLPVHPWQAIVERVGDAVSSTPRLKKPACLDDDDREEMRFKKMNDQSFYTVEEIRTRLSISTYAFFMYRPISKAVFQELADHGIRRIELAESREQFDMADAGSMKLIGDTMRSCGIELVAYHAHETLFFDLESEKQRIARVDLCRRQIDTMLSLGGAVWGSHAQTINRMVVKCYEDLARHVEGTPAVITVENFPRQDQMVEDRMKFLNQMDHPKVGMILDIGHVLDSEGLNPMTVRGGPTEVLRMCGSRLLHVHLHGFKDVDHYPPIVDDDRIQWVELFRMLRAVEYSGAFNFESQGMPRHADTLAAVAAVPERLARLAAEGQGSAGN